jgi:flagellar biosynthesis GTPase FlhF
MEPILLNAAIVAVIFYSAHQPERIVNTLPEWLQYGIVIIVILPAPPMIVGVVSCLLAVYHEQLLKEHQARAEQQQHEKTKQHEAKAQAEAAQKKREADAKAKAEREARQKAEAERAARQANAEREARERARARHDAHSQHHTRQQSSNKAADAETLPDTKFWWLHFDLKPEATVAEIKARYKQLVKQYHPDLSPTPNTDRLRTVIEAYGVAKRAKNFS